GDEPACGNRAGEVEIDVGAIGAVGRHRPPAQVRPPLAKPGGVRRVADEKVEVEPGVGGAVEGPQDSQTLTRSPRHGEDRVVLQIVGPGGGAPGELGVPPAGARSIPRALLEKIELPRMALPVPEFTNTPAVPGPLPLKAMTFSSPAPVPPILLLLASV